MWRQRLPHWRADDVVYYVNFKHRRDLNDKERVQLYRRVVALRDLDIFALAVFSSHTELMALVRPTTRGKERDLGDIVDRAKKKVSREALKKTGEKYDLFFSESYDRIVRSQDEFESFCESILETLDTFEQAGLDIDTVWFAEESPEAYPDSPN